jgi:hypothetical protein
MAPVLQTYFARAGKIASSGDGARGNWAVWGWRIENGELRIGDGRSFLGCE